MRNSDRQREIDLALCRLAARRRPAMMPALSSGCAAIDVALGTGGFPRGSVTEIFGPPAGGKTTIALHATASCQARGGTAVFLDADGSFDRAYAEKIGINPETLIMARPESGEEALEMVRQLAGSGSVDLIVLDSIAALVPRVELAGLAGAPNLHRRMLTQALRRVCAAASRGGGALLFLNQVRQRPDTGAGNPERPTGGPALGLYAAVRAEVRAVAPLYRGEILAGRRTRLTVIKNRLASAAGIAEFDVFYGEGIRNAP